MTVIYNNNYTDMLVACKRCFLFTGLFSKIEITKFIQKVEYIGGESKISIISVLTHGLVGGSIAGVPGVVLGSMMAQQKDLAHFLVYLSEEIIAVSTDDYALVHYLLKKVS